MMFTADPNIAPVSAMGKKSKSAASTEAGASQPSGKQAKPQADKQAKPAKADEPATGDKKRAAKATIDDIFGKKKKPRAGEEQAKVEEDDKGASVSHSALEELGKQIQEARATTKVRRAACTPIRCARGVPGPSRKQGCAADRPPTTHAASEGRWHAWLRCCRGAGRLCGGCAAVRQCAHAGAPAPPPPRSFVLPAPALPLSSEQAPKVVGSKDDIFGENTGARKRTVDGLVIYSEDELGLSKKGGGDTDLCPFDCDCCF